MKQLVIIGAGGHARVVADLVRQDYDEMVFLDDNTTIANVAGPVKDFKNYPQADFIVAIGNNDTRKRIQNQLEKSRMTIVTIIAKNAVLGSNVQVGKGVVIMSGVIVNN